MTRALLILLALLLPSAAFAQVCPGGSTCSPLETYIYGQSAATAPYGVGLRIPVAPSASASGLQYIPGNVLVTLTDTQTLTGKTLTAPVMTAPVLGTPASGNATNLTSIPVANATGLLPVANGGTGTASPALVQGTGITITGSWPNQTVTSSGATTVASGTAALGTGAITSATCATAVTATATGTATTDVLTASFNSDPTAVTGYIPATTGMLTIISYPTLNTANFKVCNNTASSVTPGAITLNWRVVR